jgi:hypothetical protein
MGQIANTDYTLQLFNYAIYKPYGTVRASAPATNMEYLLKTIDFYNNKYASAVTTYGSMAYASKQAADITATKTAVNNLFKGRVYLSIAQQSANTWSNDRCLITYEYTIIDNCVLTISCGFNKNRNSIFGGKLIIRVAHSNGTVDDICNEGPDTTIKYVNYTPSVIAGDKISFQFSGDRTSGTEVYMTVYDAVIKAKRLIPM